MEEVLLPKQQTSLIIRQAMASLIGQMTSYSLDQKQRYEEITFANLFDSVGYGFVGVRSKKTCPYRILIEVHPEYNILYFQFGEKIRLQAQEPIQEAYLAILGGCEPR